MLMKWYGHAAFGLFPDSGPSIITDPYTPEGVGYDPIPDTADVVLISSDDDDAHCRADLIPGDPHVINALTVAQSGGISNWETFQVKAIEAAEWDHHPEHAVPGQNGMYRFELDGIRFAHMGDVGNPLSVEQMDFYQDVDVLLALAGGYLTIELPDLMKMINRVKPRLIIPMHFRTLTYRPRNTFWIESFLEYFDDSSVSFACSSQAHLTAESLPTSTEVLVMDYYRQP